MEKWVMAVYTNCTDPAREDEFNRWYDEIHLPDVLEVPGFVRAVRFVNRRQREGEAKYLALYEVETEDINKTRAALTEHMEKKGEQGRMSDVLALASMGLYRQISALEASS